MDFHRRVGSAFVYWHCDSINQCLGMDLLIASIWFGLGWTEGLIRLHKWQSWGDFFNGNRCSFPLMVRCRAVLLYLEMFYMERALLLRDITTLWYPWDLFGICYVITNWELWHDRNFILLFSPPEKKKIIISDSIMASVRLDLVGVIGL